MPLCRAAGLAKGAAEIVVGPEGRTCGNLAAAATTADGGDCASFIQSGPICCPGAGDFWTCAAAKCNVRNFDVPEGWGASKEAALASIRGDAAIAKAMDCICKNCTDFDWMKAWPVNPDVAACVVAGEVADGAGGKKS